ncbi:putative ubiquitin hydrolase putative cysteine peptidase Clan CA family C19 [Leptomonas seymouri]|uniref:ubiquitinyl hydrolase 1 n=1 Tax=Leptomonas seymouri TaxID=5684 RepID=A0A0N0P5E3_LEPSE|nr:putative ubiquitin hydrolase putative cysteine peptidase Clan CA family C19 [Leptomonas seymouri]|eukprot:KPI86366.1 putative ubiquitin hydrolase putative cysteine peptidase Clan CA family C19 [Leptomonas seymouri]
MAKAKGGSRGSRDASSGCCSSAQLRHVRQTLERLSLAKFRIEHPAPFLLGRIRTIERWQLSVKKMNLLQLGASLVRGVLQRGHQGAHPLRVFDTVDDSFPLSLHAAPAQAVAPPGSENLSDLKAASAAANEYREPPRCCHVHHHTSASMPSVARAVLVQSASEASPELYMGLLVEFFGHGISSLVQREGSPPAATPSDPSDDRYPSAPAAVVSNNSASSAEENATPPTGLRLSSEATYALHEIHRAAREIIHCMFTEETALLSKTAPGPAREAQPNERPAPHTADADHLTYERCVRLTRLTANLYSLLSLLDFFSVEAEWVNTAEEYTSRGDLSKAAPASSPPELRAERSSDGATGKSQGSEPAIALNEPATAAAVSSAHRVKAVYTVEHFHDLFSTAGHLPRCVWDIVAAATTVLSQCDVSWSLTHGNAAAAANFNATASVVFSQSQLSLLRQMHRLCHRFELLRQRVYALYPVSPARFKVKQILDWGGFLYVNDPTFRLSLEGSADLIDMHDDDLHRMYALRPRCGIAADNRASILLVAATPYTPRTPQGTPNAAAASAFLPMAASTATEACAMPVSSLIATLASVGTHGFADGSRRRLSPLNSGLDAAAAAATARSSDGYGATSLASPAPQPSAAGRLSTVPGWVGMRNSGNTCFLNSVVQLLSSAVLFRESLMARVQQSVFQRSAVPSSESRHISASDASPPNATAAPYLTSLLQKYGCQLAVALVFGELQWRAQHRHEEYPVLPDYLITQLPAPFNDHRQHDASEYLHALLDQLDEPAQPGGAEVCRWFSGQTATVMTCTGCSHARTHVNAFWDVSTPILGLNASEGPQSEGGNSGGADGERAGEGQPATSHALTAAAAGSKADAAKQLVEVQHFKGATATTTTYVSPSPDGYTAAPAPAPAESTNKGGGDAQPAISNSNSAAVTPLLPSSSSAASYSADTSGGSGHSGKPPLQHLLLRVLHPTLNKELLHSGNALYCEHCGQRTDTVLTTQLVAEISSDEALCLRNGRLSGRITPALASTSAEDKPANGTTSPTASAPTLGEGGSKADALPPDSTAKTQSSEGAEDMQPKRHDSSSPLSASHRTIDTSAAAGGGLPWYLAVQLNRFAYQRSTQSYAKVVKGVPLNEILLLPAYPMEERPPAPRRAAEDAPGDGTGAQQLRQHPQPHSGHDNSHEESEAAAQGSRSGSSNSKTVTATPVWVAYRLQAIVIHSGSTLSSGHYFALARSSHSPRDAAADAHSEHPAQPPDTGSTPQPMSLEGIRTYVHDLGTALASVLDVHDASSAYPPASATAATVAAPPRHERLPEAGEGNEEKLLGNSASRTPVVRSARSKGHGVQEEKKLHVQGTASPAPPPSGTAPTSSDAATAAEAENETCPACRSEEQTHPSPPRASPDLPPAAVSVSGAAFFENWVMLDDSNVQVVPPETMRRVLGGEGGGVYSALETPYLMLYEKVPVCYWDDSRGNAGEEGGREGASLGGSAASPCVLQQLWEGKRREAPCPLASSSASPVAAEELAPEAVAVFRERLCEAEVRTRAPNTHAATASHTAPSAASAGALVPYYFRDGDDASTSATHAAAATTPFAATNPLQAHTHSTVHARMTPSSAALNSSKRLRAKAAAYAQQTSFLKERLSHQRLAHTPVFTCRKLDSVKEMRKDAPKEGQENTKDSSAASDDADSLD